MFSEGYPYLRMECHPASIRGNRRRRHKVQAIPSTRAFSISLAGVYWWCRFAESWAKASRSSSRKIPSLDNSPCEIALRETIRFPSADLGPVDLFAFRRLASIWAFVANESDTSL